MRYITDIQRARSDGSIEHMSAIQGYFSYALTLQVYDDETGEIESVNLCDCSDKELLGFSAVALADLCTAVCHDAKTALLYKYVIYAGTVNGSSRVLNGADYCTLGNGCTIADKNSRNTTLDIHFVHDSVLLEGKFGSAVSYQNGSQGGEMVCSLYEFLGFLCREIGVNVMRYELIQLYKPGKTSYNTIIRLLHTPESDRYFTKMYLDVLRQ